MASFLKLSVIFVFFAVILSNCHQVPDPVLFPRPVEQKAGLNEFLFGRFGVAQGKVNFCSDVNFGAEHPHEHVLVYGYCDRERNSRVFTDLMQTFALFGKHRKIYLEVWDALDAWAIVPKGIEFVILEKFSGDNELALPLTQKKKYVQKWSFWDVLPWVLKTLLRSYFPWIHWTLVAYETVEHLIKFASAFV